MAGTRATIAPRSNDVMLGHVILLVAMMAAGGLVVFAGATGGMSRYLYVTVDVPGFGVAAALGLLSWVFLFGERHPLPLRFPGTLRPGHVAVVTLVATAAAVQPIYHGYAFSADEFLVRLQGEIFAAGRLSGLVPEGWRAYGQALFHPFAHFDAESGRLASSYRPGMALLYAIGLIAGLGNYVSVFLNAGSVLLASSLARRLWPQSEEAPLVAAVLVATSQQAAITSLTSYSMPAHLFFNLLWLRLFLSGTVAGHVFAPFVGVWTASLHQVHMHAFFALPFLLTLLRPFRPGLVTWYGAVYLAGHLAVIGWDRLAMGDALATAQGSATMGFAERVADLVRLPDAYALETVAALLVRFFAWQNLALVPLLLLVARDRPWPRVQRLLLWSIVVSLLPYPVLMPDQGHGWGYRYLHGLIGNFALLGTAGWLAIGRLAPAERPRIRRAVIGATAITALVMIPFRAFQVERTVRPYADAAAYIAALPAEVVVIDAQSLFYGDDLVRNGPFLANRPVVVNLKRMDEPALAALCRGHEVTFLDAGDLARFGLADRRSTVTPSPERRRMLAMLKSPACTRPKR